MNEIKDLEKTSITAIKKLRQHKFVNGLPFMINTNSLPSNQCYLEYSDGKVVLVSITGTSKDFTIIKELSDQEALIVRRKHLSSLQ